MKDMGYIDSVVYYGNYVTNVINQADMMLADFNDLKPEQVELISTLKNKFTCIMALLQKGEILMAFRLEEDAMFDVRDILKFMGFNQAADQMIKDFPFCLS
jgi:hypothetical protein